MGRYRVRKKGTFADGTPKYLVEKQEYAGWRSRTLPPPNELWDMLCPDIMEDNVSEKGPEKVSDVHQEFGHEILSEPVKQDIKRTLTPEELKKLWEITK